MVRRNVGPPQFVCLKGGGDKGAVMLAFSAMLGSHLEFLHWYIEVHGAEAGTRRQCAEEGRRRQGRQ